jgi:outer membrane protein assembly factor BamB
MVAVVVTLLAGAAPAADWPQWRGPDRNGISKETGLLKEWPKDGPKLLWQIKNAGTGYSTPSVVGDQLFLLGNEGNDNEYVSALSVKDGSQVWSTRIGKVGNPDMQPSYPAARSTPTVDGALLYALGSDGDLACLETATGKIRWQKSLRTDFGGKPGKWAYAESPLIDGDVLICTPGGTEAAIVALKKATGETIWKCALPEAQEAAYASAVILETGGKKQYVQFLQKNLVGVDAKTGQLLWKYGHTAQGSPANIPTPLVDGGYVYSAASRTGGGLVRLKPGDSGIEVEELYFSPKLPTAIGGAVKLGDCMYGTTGQGLLCVEFKSGEVKWQERSVGAGSVCSAEGLLYLHGESGETALVEASPEAYKEKGRFTPQDQPQRGSSKAWAYPVVANGRLYLRDMRSVWCYDIKAR